MIQDILFCGNTYSFEIENPLISLGVTFGFMKDKDGVAVIGNRIFETKLYDLFLSESAVDSAIYESGAMERSQYIINGALQMKLVMEKFCQHFTEIYSDSDQKFIEKQGRKIFLLYLKPIINGKGNYYIEAQTRDMKRTDIIVDYQGRQYIIELKIWHGNEYNQRGERQLFEYLEYYNSDMGYLLSFNFNKNKYTGRIIKPLLHFCYNCLDFWQLYYKSTRVVIFILIFIFITFIAYSDNSSAQTVYSRRMPAP